MYALVALLLMCVDVMVMSSAHELIYSSAGGCYMPDVYMLKSCGVEDAALRDASFIGCCVDACSLNVLYDMRTLI